MVAPTSVLGAQTGTAGVTTHTTASFTPPANSTLYVYSHENPAHTTTIASTPALQWSQEATSGPAGANNDREYLWSAPIGSSPASTTVTFTYSAAAFAGYAIFAVPNTLRIKPGQIATSAQGSGTPTDSGTLPNAATTGNTTLALFGQNDDSGSGIPTPAGFTTVTASPAGGGVGFCPVRASYSDTFTGTNATVVQDETGNGSGGMLVELETIPAQSEGSKHTSAMRAMMEGRF